MRTFDTPLFTTLLVFVFILSRILCMGQEEYLDQNFSEDGRFVSNFGFENEYSDDMAIQSDGKIVVSGITDEGVFQEQSILLFRLNQNGELDESFGSEGMVILDIDGFSGEDLVLDILSDGSIVVFGQVINDNTDLIVVKFSVDGILDVTFGDAGVVEFDHASAINWAGDIKVRNDEIFVSGAVYFPGVESYSDVFMAKMDSDGNLDESFANNGIFVQSIGEQSHDMAHAFDFFEDGKIVMAGYSGVILGNDFHAYLLKLNVDGSVDTSFGDNGILIHDEGEDSSNASSIKVQNDQKIILGGSLNYNDESAPLVKRFLSDGTIDESFDSSVALQVGFGEGSQTIGDLLLDDEERVVLAISGCFDENDPQSVYRLARLNESGDLDLSFGSGGMIYAEASNYLTEKKIALTDNNEILHSGHIFGLALEDSSKACVMRFADFNTTAIESIATEDKFIVYPNPSNGIINISITSDFNLNENFSIELFSLDGKRISVLSTNEMLIQNSQSIVFDNELPNGQYLLRCLNQHRIFTTIVTLHR